MSNAVPVVVTASGFTWTTGLMALLNIFVGGLLVALVRTRPALKKIAAEREVSLLEARGEDMVALRDRIDKLEALLERKEAEHEGEIRVMRHRLNNVTQCFDALILLIETDPAKASQAVSRIKDMRARQLEAEAAEKGAMSAAKIESRGPT